jgi:hypothetical protein
VCRVVTCITLRCMHGFVLQHSSGVNGNRNMKYWLLNLKGSDHFGD